MVDRFGRRLNYGTRGLRGIRGPPGIAGGIKDLMYTILYHLRKYDEIGCFIIESEKDVKRSGQKITTWVTKTEKSKNLIAIKGREATKIEQITDGKMVIKMDNCAYYLEKLLFGNEPGCGFICITFQCNKSDHIMVLASNFTQMGVILHQTEEILCSQTHIIIRGHLNSKEHQHKIENDNKAWTTIFLQYNITPDRKMLFEYTLQNQKHGTFEFQAPALMQSGFFIGSRPIPHKEVQNEDTPIFFSGRISSFELYFSPDNTDTFPSDLKKAILKDQTVDLI